LSDLFYRAKTPSTQSFHSFSSSLASFAALRESVCPIFLSSRQHAKTAKFSFVRNSARGGAVDRGYRGARRPKDSRRRPPG
jgi:hypothetical protein